MEIKTGKKDKIKIIAFVLLIALCVTLIPITSMGDEGDPLDVTNYVDFGGYDIYLEKNNQKIVENGVLVEGASLKVGDNIYMRYYWSVSNANMEYITPGAFFTIDLPADIFDFTAISEGSQYPVGSGTTQIGTFSLKKSGSTATLKMVFNETGANANEIKDGWLRADGKVKSIPEDTTSAAIDNLIIPIEVTTDPGGGTTSTKKDGPNWSWSDGNGSDFNKTSSFSKYTGVATYTMNVNNLKFTEAFKGDTSTGYEDVLIEDELQDGIKYIDNSLEIYTNHYFAKGQNTTESAVISPTAMSASTFAKSNLLSQFDLYIPADPAMEYEDFKAEIKSKGKPTYGIWQNKKIVINAGDLPGTLKFTHTWLEIKALIDSTHRTVTWTTYQKTSDGSIELDTSGNAIVESTTTYEAYSPSVKEATKKAWAKLYNVPVDDMDDRIYDNNIGEVVGFTMTFKTQVTGADRSVENVAVMYYDGGEKNTNNNSFSFASMSGGANMGSPGDVRLIKYDGASNEVLEDVEFKIQKYSKKTEKYEDIEAGKKGSGTFTTDKDGSILISELPYGKYRFVETKWPAGYKEDTAFYEGDGTFEIDGTEEDVIGITALNYKEDKVLDEEAFDEEGDGNVLGEEAGDDDEGSVLGEEAKTGDFSALTWMLIIMLIASVIALAGTLKNIYSKE